MPPPAMRMTMDLLKSSRSPPISRSVGRWVLAKCILGRAFRLCCTNLQILHVPCKATRVLSEIAACQASESCNSRPGVLESFACCTRTSASMCLTSPLGTLPPSSTVPGTRLQNQHREYLCALLSLQNSNVQLLICSPIHADRPLKKSDHRESSHSYECQAVRLLREGSKSSVVARGNAW